MRLNILTESSLNLCPFYGEFLRVSSLESPNNKYNNYTENSLVSDSSYSFQIQHVCLSEASEFPFVLFVLSGKVLPFSLKIFLFISVFLSEFRIHLPFLAFI